MLHGLDNWGPDRSKENVDVAVEAFGAVTSSSGESANGKADYV